jgi:hypothetical protein
MNKSKYIVTFKGFTWLIIMGSGFVDWVYWHFYTITFNFNGSHIEFRLNNVSLVNALWRICYCPERHLSDEWISEESARLLYRLAHIHGNPCKWFVVRRMCLAKRWLLSNRGSTIACITSGICLPKRCLADDHIPSQYLYYTSKFSKSSEVAVWLHKWIQSTFHFTTDCICVTSRKKSIYVQLSQ